MRPHLAGFTVETQMKTVVGEEGENNPSFRLGQLCEWPEVLAIF